MQKAFEEPLQMLFLLCQTYNYCNMYNKLYFMSKYIDNGRRFLVK